MKERHIYLQAARIPNKQKSDAASPGSVGTLSLMIDVRDSRRPDKEAADADLEMISVAPSIPMKLVRPFSGPNDSRKYKSGLTWGVKAVGADTSPYTGDGIVVAVLDTGIDSYHKAFSGITIIQKDFTGEGDGDQNGHGTHCAGTIFGRNIGKMRIGIATGVKKVLIAKVLDRKGKGTSEMTIAGILWAVQMGANIISMSLEIDLPSLQQQVLNEKVPGELATSIVLERYSENVLLFERLASLIFAQGESGFTQSTILIAAAGNENAISNDPDWKINVGSPAVSKGIISVAALEQQAQGLSGAPFLNSSADIAAPGVAIVSARAGGGLSVLSGTSMAGAHVAAVAALWAESLLSKGRLKPGQLTAKLMASATRDGLPGNLVTADIGAGLVQAPQQNSDILVSTTTDNKTEVDSIPAAGSGLPEDVPGDASDLGYPEKEERHMPLLLEKTVIAEPLFREFADSRKQQEKFLTEKGKTLPEPVYSVIIDVNFLYHAGREKAKQHVQSIIDRILSDDNFTKKAKEDRQGVNPVKTRFSQQYVFAVLEERVIKEMVRIDQLSGKGNKGLQSIYHIWPDFVINPLTTKSVATVKADAARNTFSALGEDIYWAVMDSGIDGSHLHFEAQQNLVLPPVPDPLQHRDFTVFSTALSTSTDISQDINLQIEPNEKPLEDEYGHGTHVAGIIAGELENTDDQEIVTVTMRRDENKEIKRTSEKLPPKSRISGMAPKSKLVSLKVLDNKGQGQVSNLIAAIQWIQEINGYGRRIRIHGVNMSVGYEFEPEWFACGQSPLCVEVDRLVKSGVVVVVAAGNTGYGFIQAQSKRNAVTAGIDLTINDPGNAELAITVGSTHREMPHVYGVSYFSSKGPTGDGRLKPDLVAPGEKIISCDSSQRRSKDPTATADPQPPADAVPGNTEPGNEKKTGYYRESSGTSVSAPHVSGVIAAFLSVRREFIGKPEIVKEIFLSTATDLKREKYFQGHGLVDLMRAIQSV